MSAAILVVEDERTLGRAITLYLQESGYAVTLVTSAEEGLAAFERERPDLVVADVRLPGMSGTDLLDRLRAADATVPVVLMTAHGTIEGAVAAVKRGAFDYLKKPLDLEELRLLAERALRAARTTQELEYLRARVTQPVAPGHALIGEAPAFRAVLERARQVAALDDPPPVLITGETGTGKGVIARTLHASGPRARQPFIDINCAALPGSLMEAELFGYEKGAFTDAKTSKLGLFEAAEGGFLFLDEVGELELALQGKLLRAIEERTVRRVGGLRDRTVDVRIVAATNRHLEQDAQANRFRKDLFFRLAVIVLHLPPLRERTGDIAPLAAHYLRTYAHKYGRPARTLSAEARTRLERYPWPGNVRELSHVIERAVLWTTDDTIELEHLGLLEATGPAPDDPTRVPGLPPEGTDLASWERAMLEQALRDAGGNQTRAAQRLGITRDTLRYRLKKYGIGGG